MANKSSFNSTINTNTVNNMFYPVWLLTRMMKAAGWTFMAGSAGNTTTTTIAGGSITFPQATVTVAATGTFPTAGSFTVAGVTGTVSYTGTTGTTFTGCTGGTGTVTTGATVTPIKTTNAVQTNDPWGGNADPTLDIYQTNFDTKQAWIVLQRLSMVKIAVTANSTGTFVRGEQVSQATSGATGECKGFVFDTIGANNGWMIIAPRTGTFDGTHVITGAISGATITATSVKFYYHEIMFWKSTDVQNGNCYYICADGTAESAQLYSTLATSTGCTSTIGPGGGGTGNTFPTLGLTARGNAGSASFSNWFFQNVTNNGTHCNAMAFNATGASNVSADGSFWVTVPSTAAGNPLYFFGFFICDHGEPGDVDPYVWRYMNGVGVASYSRLSSTSYVSTPTEAWSNFSQGINSSIAWMGYCTRGTGFTTDIPVGFYANWENDSAGSQGPLVNNITDQVREQNHPSATKPLVLIDFCVANNQTNTQMRKGRPRWMRFCPVGNQLDTVGSLQWLVLISQNGTQSPAVLLGKWDGATTPTT